MRAKAAVRAVVRARCPCYKAGSSLCGACRRRNYEFLFWLRSSLGLEMIPNIIVRIRKQVPREPLWKRALEARKMAG